MPDFGPNNFLREVKQTTTGSNLGTNCDGGFLRDVDVTPQFSALTIALGGLFGTGSTLSTGTATPTYTPALLASTGTSTFGPFFVRRDYDQTSDQFQLRFLGSTAGSGQSTISLIGSLTVYSTGASASATSPVSTSATVVNNGQLSNIGWQMQGFGLQYPDAFTITMSTSGGNYQVIAASEVVSDCLVAWADYNNTGLVTEQVGGSTQQIRTA